MVNSDAKQEDARNVNAMLRFALRRLEEVTQVCFLKVTQALCS
jgi:hypothetical protein